jgi:thymidylate kinase
VAQAFERFAAEAPERFVRIEAAGEPEMVHGRVMAALERL